MSNRLFHVLKTGAVRKISAVAGVAVVLASVAYASNVKENLLTEPLTLMSASKGGSSKSAASMARVPGADERIEKRESPLGLVPLANSSGGGLATDPALNSRSVSVQTNTGASAAGFDGIGLSRGFSVNSLPPDTTGAAGDTQYVQYVNSVYAVFDKSTGYMCTRVNGVTTCASDTKAFFKLSDLFKSAGDTTPCASRNDGDPIVQFDAIARRWILSQFAIPNGKYYQCVAVSKTSDATGEYWIYAFQQPYFNDYPKMGVWPDGYYTTFNMFKGSGFKGGVVCVFERARMLQGLTARQYCSSPNSGQPSLMPTSLDGKMTDLNSTYISSVIKSGGDLSNWGDYNCLLGPACPPVGMKNVIANINGSQLRLGSVSINWSTGAGSVTWPTVATGAATYSAGCGGGSCVPQATNSRKLTAMSDRLMYRLAYIRPCTDSTCSAFGDGYLFVNHAVATDVNNASTSRTGIRWYSLKSPSSLVTDNPNSLSILQQSTYAPSDTYFRSMGSIAADRNKNIVLGYSRSSTSDYPSVTVAYGATTSSTTFSTEIVAKAGSGAQTSYSRWGDYSHMSLDPVDGCTMWYTSEYIQSDGNFNWSTFIYPYKVSTCN